MDDRLNLATAAGRLGVADMVLNETIHSGFLSLIRNEYDDGPRLSRVAIDYVVSDLAANARRISRSDDSLMSLTEAARTGSGGGGASSVPYD
jgi:hypothetical protein